MEGACAAVTKEQKWMQEDLEGELQGNWDYKIRVEPWTIFGKITVELHGIKMGVRHIYGGKINELDRGSDKFEVSLAAVPVGGDSIFEISGYGQPSERPTLTCKNLFYPNMLSNCPLGIDFQIKTLIEPEEIEDPDTGLVSMTEGFFNTIVRLGTWVEPSDVTIEFDSKITIKDMWNARLVEGGVIKPRAVIRLQKQAGSWFGERKGAFGFSAEGTMTRLPAISCEINNDFPAPPPPVPPSPPPRIPPQFKMATGSSLPSPFSLSSSRSLLSSAPQSLPGLPSLSSNMDTFYTLMHSILYRDPENPSMAIRALEHNARTRSSTCSAEQGFFVIGKEGAGHHLMYKLGKSIKLPQCDHPFKSIPYGDNWRGYPGEYTFLDERPKTKPSNCKTILMLRDTPSSTASAMRRFWNYDRWHRNDSLTLELDAVLASTKIMNTIAETIDPVVNCTLVLNFDLLLRYPMLHLEPLAEFFAVPTNHTGLLSFLQGELQSVEVPETRFADKDSIDVEAMLRPTPCSSSTVNIIGRKLANWWDRRSEPPARPEEQLDRVFDATRNPCAGGIPRPDKSAFECGAAWWRTWQNYTKSLHELYPNAAIARPMSICEKYHSQPGAR